MKILVINDLDKRLINRMILLNDHRIIKYYTNCLVIKFYNLKLIDVGTKDSSKINGFECHKLLKGIHFVFYFLNTYSNNETTNDDYTIMESLKTSSLLEDSKFYAISENETSNYENKYPIGYELSTFDIIFDIIEIHMINSKLNTIEREREQEKKSLLQTYHKMFFSDNYIKKI
jgi:hypothetical protein